MIIDGHIHIGKTEKTKRSYTLETYYNLMKRNNVDKSMVMPNLSSIIDTSILNKQLMDEYLSSDLKENFYPLIVMDPKDRKTLRQIDTYSDIIHGLKYHPSISETPLDDPALYDFLDCAFKLKLPVLIHCGRHWRSNIKYIVRVAKKLESINFIAAHLGGNATDIIEKAIDILAIEKLDNVYLDTSAGKLPWLIEEAIKNIGLDKIIFGSDEPYADLTVSKYCIDLCHITDSDKEELFHKNFERVYINGN